MRKTTNGYECKSSFSKRGRRRKREGEGKKEIPGLNVKRGKKVITQEVPKLAAKSESKQRELRK